MQPERRPLTLVSPDGRTVPGEFLLWEESPGNPDRVRLAVTFADVEVVREEDDYFTALCGIREELEAVGLIPRCHGSSRDVHPSGMSLGMGSGGKAYRLCLGRPARTADLVDIFDDGPGVDPVSVAAQEGYYRQWLGSLG